MEATKQAGLAMAEAMICRGGARPYNFLNPARPEI